MGKRRGVWFAVVLAASSAAIASPAAAAKATVPGAPTITYGDAGDPERRRHVHCARRQRRRTDLELPGRVHAEQRP